MAPVRIRPACNDDLSELATLAARTFTDNFGYLYEAPALRRHLEKTCSQAFFEQSLRQGDTILLALAEGVIIGYAKAGALGLPVDSPPAGATELHRFYLQPSFHGTGVAHTLMQAIMQVPILRDASTVYVGVWEHNLRAQRFYARYGFTPAGEYLYRVEHHADRELILAKKQLISQSYPST